MDHWPALVQVGHETGLLRINPSCKGQILAKKSSVAFLKGDNAVSR